MDADHAEMLVDASWLPFHHTLEQLSLLLVRPGVVEPIILRLRNARVLRRLRLRVSEGCGRSAGLGFLSWRHLWQLNGAGATQMGDNARVGELGIPGKSRDAGTEGATCQGPHQAEAQDVWRVIPHHRYSLHHHERGRRGAQCLQ